MPVAIDPAIVAAVISATGVGVGWWVNRRLSNAQAENFDADAAKKIVDSARDLLPLLTKRIDDLQETVTQMSVSLTQAKTDLDAANERIRQMTDQAQDRDVFIVGLLAGITVLVGQLREAKLEPRYTPPAAKAGTGPLGARS